MNHQDKIIAHLKKTYDPVGIYLSGSRARGRERENSDWDIHLVVDDTIVPLSTNLNGESNQGIFCLTL